MRLRAALDDALRRRDRLAVSALRPALSAIGNAEAVSPPPGMPAAGSPHIAGAVSGLNAGEVQRRTLSTTEVDQLIRAEISERLLAARDYESSGHADRERRLRSEADILTSVASGGAPHSYGTG
jgi:hypothetical protein